MNAFANTSVLQPYPFLEPQILSLPFDCIAVRGHGLEAAVISDRKTAYLLSRFVVFVPRLIS